MAFNEKLHHPWREMMWLAQFQQKQGAFFRVVSWEPLDGSAGQSDSVYFPFGSGTESHVTRFVLTLAELLESFFLKVVCESIEKVCECVGVHTRTFLFFFFLPSLLNTECVHLAK